jgi:NTP pyrophosphatase (non-canonical NTP hydrolase)
MSIHTEDEPLVIEHMVRDCVEDSKRWFPGEAQEMPNLVLCIAGEVGEVANIVKKVVRGSLRMEDAMETLPEEIVDVLIYLCNLMGHETFKDVDWRKIWDNKRQFNEMRFNR